MSAVRNEPGSKSENLTQEIDSSVKALNEFKLSLQKEEQIQEEEKELLSIKMHYLLDTAIREGEFDQDLDSFEEGHLSESVDESKKDHSGNTGDWPEISIEDEQLEAAVTLKRNQKQIAEAMLEIKKYLADPDSYEKKMDQNNCVCLIIARIGKEASEAIKALQTKNKKLVKEIEETKRTMKFWKPEPSKKTQEILEVKESIPTERDILKQTMLALLGIAVENREIKAEEICLAKTELEKYVMDPVSYEIEMPRDNYICQTIAKIGRQAKEILNPEAFAQKAIESTQAFRL